MRKFVGTNFSKGKNSNPQIKIQGTQNTGYGKEVFFGGLLSAYNKLLTSYPLKTHRVMIQAEIDLQGNYTVNESEDQMSGSMSKYFFTLHRKTELLGANRNSLYSSQQSVYVVGGGRINWGAEAINQSVDNVRFAICRYWVDFTKDNGYDYFYMYMIRFGVYATQGGPPVPYNPCDRVLGVPVVIRTGEKREKTTDLMVATPAGTLGLTRIFRQSMLDASDFQLFGRGWTHNHNLVLTPPSGMPKQLTVLDDTGQLILFEETGTGTNVYETLSGDFGTVMWTGSQYELTTLDRHSMIFNSAGQVTHRIWPNGETWSYSYSTGKLVEISDGHGRKLVFRYTVGSEVYRVGDHTFDDTNPSNPTGRYVEYGYVADKIDSGGIIDGTGAVLNHVIDVRGFQWDYIYNTTDPDQLNYLVRIESPSDPSGNGPAQALVRKDLTYTLSGDNIVAINQKLGYPVGDSASNALLNIDYAFQPDGDNETTETIAGKTVRHVFNNGVYGGAQNALGQGGDQIMNLMYRPVQQVDGNENRTRLIWREDGKQLLQVTDPLEGDTDMIYDSHDRLVLLENPDERITVYQYASNDAPRYPTTVIKAQVDANVDIDGDMELGSNWSDVGSPLRNDTVPGTQFGSHYCRGVAGDAGEGIESNSWNVVASNTYTVTAAVYSVNGKVKMKIAGTTTEAISVVEDGWEALTFDYTPSSSGTAKLQFLVDSVSSGEGVFYVDSVTIHEGTSEIDVAGDMETDAGWNDISGSAPALNLHTPDMVAGFYSRRVLVDAVDDGIASAAWNLVAGTTYVISAQVYVMKGEVSLSLSGVMGSEVSAQTSMRWEPLVLIHTATSNVSRQIQFLADVLEDSEALFYVDQVEVMTVLDWQTYTFNGQGRLTDERQIDPSDGTTVLRHTSRTYGTSGNGNGLLDSETVSDTDETTTYTYDSAGRVIKTQRSSLYGTCSFTYTVYDAAGQVIASVCHPVSVTIPTSQQNARDIYTNASPTHQAGTPVTLYNYDALGRRVQTVTNAEAPNEQTQLIGYDALDRVTRTVSNFVNNTYADFNEWVFESGVWKDMESGTPISHGTNGDENIITLTDYNTRGLIRRTQDVFGVVTLYGYDDGDRLVKTIVNASSLDYDNDYLNGDPNLGAYIPSNDLDADITTTQDYDAAGNLVKSVDASGAIMFTVYDGLNRPVKTIAAAKAAATIDLDDGDMGYDATNDPRSDAYVASTAPDYDHITETTYNTVGQVIQTRRLLDNRFENVADWQSTQMVYDGLGRVVQNLSEPVLSGTPIDVDFTGTIATASSALYSTSGAEDAINGNATDSWITELGTQHWLSLDFGAQQSKVISQYGLQIGEDHYAPGAVALQYYDGNIWQTVDIQTGLTWVDDELKTFNVPSTNYIRAQEWRVTFSSASSFYMKLGELYMQELPTVLGGTTTAYDAAGRVLTTTDIKGNVTRSVYNELGRIVRQIVNYVANAEDPSDWVWDDSDGRWETSTGTAIDHGIHNDQNLIRDTTYDSDGRLQMTRDEVGSVTLTGYDTLGRIVKMVANSTVPDYFDTYSDPDLSDYETHITVSANSAVDRISTTDYDIQGRVVKTTDTRGNVTLSGYDMSGRQVKTVQYASNPNGTFAADLSDYSGSSPDNDQDRITTTVYGLGGRVVSTTDPAGIVTRFVYDALGRRITIIHNYIAQGNSDPVEWDWDEIDDRWEDAIGNSIDHGVNNDQNRITTTVYNRAGQVTETRDAQGTITRFVYDNAGRQRQTIQAADTALETIRYTVYNKAGWVRRSIQHWIDNSTSPDGVTDSDWDFDPSTHGTDNDQNLITVFDYDATGRRIQTTNPSGNVTKTDYNTDGTVLKTIDSEGVVTRFTYDKLRRRIGVVAGYGTPPVPVICDVTAANVTDLKTEIAAANSSGIPTVICLTSNTYTLTSVDNTSDGPNGLPVITGDITIYGAGATITRNSASAFRHFKVDTGGRLVLHTITLSNGDSGSNTGGAVRNQGTLELVNTVIENNTGSYGGGIRNNNNATLIATTSIIRNNTSSTDGGGIYANNSSDTIMTNTILSGNTTNASSGSGGGLFMNGDNLTISGGVIDNNSARRGGGVYLNIVSTEAQFTDGLQLTHNQAFDKGGAVYISGGDLTLTGVVVANNVATNDSGGIRQNSGNTLTLTGCTFSGNDGGASLGGAIANFGTLAITDTWFDSNQSSTSTANGGAIYTQGNITVMGGAFTNNRAKRGGGLHISSGVVSLDGTLLSGNSASDYGGGIYTEAGTVIDLDDVVLISNTASNSGGGMYINDDFTLDDCQILNNSANTRAGGVYTSHTSNSGINNCCIVGNSAPDSSGVHSNSGTLDATGNWWGAVDGPGEDGPGSGDGVNSNVDYGSFLTGGCPL